MKKLTPSVIATLVASSLMLSACGGGSSSGSDPDPQPQPQPNSAPTDITLSSSSVMENMKGATVGQLSATDADTGDTFTFTTSSELFSINGAELMLADGVEYDFEQTESVDVEVVVTDAAGDSFTKTLTIAIDDAMDRYAFDNNMGGGDSVSYSGQTARHVLIAELNNYISSGLQSDLDDGTLLTRDDVLTKLNSFFRMSEAEYELQADTFPVAFMADTTQNSLRQLSSSHKDLVGKIAGNDAAGQHMDWNNGDFAGWGATGSTSPEGLVDILFAKLADNAATELSGATRQDPFGNDIDSIYVTADGLDLKQLIQKFLLMSVAYSQGVDDYLDSDTDGKGLNSDNTANVSGKSYTALEHNYDEGFGYFGAARNYRDYSDDEIGGYSGREAFQNGYNDIDGDGSIDLFSEYNFGQSVNAAKRDRGTASNANPTDYTAQAFDAFIAGREIIAANPGALDTATMDALKAEVALAVDAWERAIVATVIHYINDTDADLATVGTADFSYADLTKHWAEMKGFGLGIQFNRTAPLTAAQFEQLHTLFGDTPVLTDADAIAAYRADLMTARDLLEQAYGFDSDNVANW